MAAKRHYAKKDNKRAHAGEYEEKYSMDRTRAMEDGGMISNDYSQISNLPQSVMMKAYPKTGPANDECMDDTIAGVDHQMDFDDKERQRIMNPRK